MQSLAGSPVIDVSLARKQDLIRPVWFTLDKLNCVTRAGCRLPRWPWFVSWWACFLIGSGRSPQLRVIFCVNGWRFTTRSSCFDERRGKSREEIYYGRCGLSFFSHIARTQPAVAYKIHNKVNPTCSQDFVMLHWWALPNGWIQAGKRNLTKWVTLQWLCNPLYPQTPVTLLPPSLFPHTLISS